MDLTAESARNASFMLTAEHLSAWQKKHGAPPPNSVLLVNFGLGPRLRSAGSGAAAGQGPGPAPASPFTLPGMRLSSAHQGCGCG